MSGAQNKKDKQDRIYWHEAFYEALQLELCDYKDVLSFENERQLSKEALKMDVLIIKKEKNVTIDKNLGRIFRTHNIFEYKSETDSLSIADYNKVLGYALLYAAFEQIPISEITISFAVTKHPRDLMKYLESERELIIEELSNGLYYIKGDIIPVQLLERKKLSQEDNIFLRNLGSHLTVEDILSTLQIYQQQKLLNEKNTYLNRIIEANKASIEEVVTMSTALELLWEAADKQGYLEDLKQHIAEQAAKEAKLEGKIEGKLEGKSEGKLELAQKMLLDGESIERIAKWTELPLDKIMELKAGLSL